MKPKTGLIVNGVFLAICLAFLVLRYLFDDQFDVFSQIVMWILPISPICSIVHFSQLKKRQAEQLGEEGNTPEKTDQLS
jgi:hypothetical protein